MNLAAKLFLLLPVASFALGQAVPAARGPAFYTGFRLPDVSGTLTYSLSASERISIGSSSGSSYGNTTNVSGNAAYLSSSQTQPFSAVYSGAYLHGNSSATPSEIEQRLSLSQVLTTGRWQFVLSDSLSYLPESPVGNLSGVPGLGDTNVTSVSSGADSQDLLTNYAQRITNSFSGTAERSLTGATSLSGTGSESIIRYLNVPSGASTDSNGYSALASLQHRIDVRTSASLRYTYSNYTYINANYGITTQLVAVQFERLLTRNASFSGLVGPQHIVSTDAALIPPRTTVSGDASLRYTTSGLTSALTFSRTSGSGAGLVAGVSSTTARFSVDHQLGRAYHVSGNVGFLETSSLSAGAFSSHSIVFGAQANRSIMRSLSAFAGYSAQHQINNGSAIPSLALSGLIQTLSFGITYAPEGIHVGH